VSAHFVRMISRLPDGLAIRVDCLDSADRGHVHVWQQHEMVAEHAGPDGRAGDEGEAADLCPAAQEGEGHDGRRDGPGQDRQGTFGLDCI
jgi:hypothetical protein